MRLLIALLFLLLFHSLAHADLASDIAAGAQAQAESRYQDAVDIFSAAAKDHPEDGTVRYGLASALMSMDRLEEAEQLFAEAGELGFQTLGVGYRIARIRGRQGNVDAGLQKLEEIAADGFPMVNLIEDEPDFDSLRHDARYASALEIIRTNRFPCRGNSNRRLFDFWVNDWDVSSQGQSAGTNDVQLILGDCVVFENWESVAGTFGKSFNFYDPGEDHWRQIWVDDTGGVIEFTRPGT